MELSQYLTEYTFRSNRRHNPDSLSHNFTDTVRTNMKFFIEETFFLRYFAHYVGGMPERSNGAVSKTVVPFGYRGFESHFLRHSWEALFLSYKIHY